MYFSTNFGALQLVLQAVNLTTFWPEIHGLYLREVSVKEKVIMVQLQNIKEEHVSFFFTGMNLWYGLTQWL